MRKENWVKGKKEREKENRSKYINDGEKQSTMKRFFRYSRLPTFDMIVFLNKAFKN